MPRKSLRPTIDKTHNRVRVIVNKRSKYFGPSLGKDASQDARSWAMAYEYIASLNQERELLHQVAAAAPPVAPQPRSMAQNWAQVWLAYLDYAKGVYTKRGRHTSQWYRCTRTCELFLAKPERHRQTLSALPGAPGVFGPKSLLELRDEIARSLEPARRTLNDYIGCVLQTARWAESREMADPGYADWLAKIPALIPGRRTSPEAPILAEKQKKLPPDPMAIKKTIEHCSPMIAAMVLLQQLVGMRAEEVCGLRVDSIHKVPDLESWVYTVPESHNKLAHKGVERRTCWGLRGQTIVKPWIDLAVRHGEPFVFCPRITILLQLEERTLSQEVRLAKHYQHPAVRTLRKIQRENRSPRRAKDYYSKDSYCRAISRAFEKTGLDKQLYWTPGRLRHKGGSDLYKKTKDKLMVAKMLGHSSSKTTEANYISIDDTEIVRFAEANL